MQKLRKSDKIKAGLQRNAASGNVKLVTATAHERAQASMAAEVAAYAAVERGEWKPRYTWQKPPCKPDVIARMFAEAPCFDLPRAFCGKLILFTRTRYEYPPYNDGDANRVQYSNHDPCVYIPFEFFQLSCEGCPNLPWMYLQTICAQIESSTLADAIRDHLICDDGSLHGTFRFGLGSVKSGIRVLTPLDAIPEEIYV